MKRIFAVLCICFSMMLTNAETYNVIVNTGNFDASSDENDIAITSQIEGLLHQGDIVNLTIEGYFDSDVTGVHLIVLFDNSLTADYWKQLSSWDLGNIGEFTSAYSKFTASLEIEVTDDATSSDKYVIRMVPTGCSGIVKLRPICDAPIVSDVSYCIYDTPTPLSATAISGATLNWYGTNETGGTATSVAPTPSIYNAGVTYYYVSQTCDGFESARARITVYTKGTGHPTISSTFHPAEVCEGELNPTFVAYNVIGSVYWYEEDPGELGVPQSTPKGTENTFVPSGEDAGTYTIWAVMYADGCYGPKVLAVYTIKALPDAPVTNDSEVCYGESNTSVYVPGAGGAVIKWYADAQKQTLLKSNSSIYTSQETSPGMYSYYASQVISGCESLTASEATFTIKQLPNAPLVTPQSNVCEFDKAPVLYAKGENITWYADDKNTVLAVGESYQTTDMNIGEKRYYASQSVLNCEGEKAEIIYTIYEQPSTNPIPDISINEEDVIPIMHLSDYFVTTAPEGFEYTVMSSNNRIAYPVLMGNKLGFVKYGVGSTIITITATVGSFSTETSFTVTINPTQPEIPCNLSLSSEITNVACNGEKTGKIEVSVSGGAEPYYYKWNTGRTSSGLYNVGAGTYSVLVMDENGCTVEQSFVVTEPSALEISETLTPSTCGGNNGKIEVSVSGGNAPYSYSWKNFTETASSLENVSAGSYEVTVTDGNSCKQTKTISLADQGAATITQKTINPSKCNEATGNVLLSVTGGTKPYTYIWSDSIEVADELNRLHLYAGSYNLQVVDSKNCNSIMSIQVPLIPLRQPKLALVSYDDTLKHNIVVWQKENTDDIDQYYIYREIDSLGNYDKIDSLSYSEISVYVDETAQHKKQAYRYEISAMNSCMESPASKEFKTINLQRKIQDDGSILLWWNAYEGCEYVEYSLYRLTKDGGEFMLKLPANKFRYVDEKPKEGTIGYYILIHLSEAVDVAQLLKAERPTYDYIISTIAYILTELEDDSIDKVGNNAIVYTKNKTIFISNAGENNIFVCDMTGKIIAQRQKVDSAEISVKTAGVYVVIVGDRVFKLRIMN